MQVAVRTAELDRVNRALASAADRVELRRQMRSELYTEARQVLLPLRAAIMATPSRAGPRRDGRRPLRQLIAGAASIQVRTTGDPRVRVFMDGRKMPDRMKSLPAYMEGAKPHWRHPVHGVWRRGLRDQMPHPYFERGTRGISDDAVAGMERVLERTARKIEGR